ncbi:hypothetical protein K458DRAFT_451500 [Lentithecium fluviatile CBS 122367]|uniref:Uncharacterized protein n=1 Tax=Lentithecium fluviatile CBS 122367 TaxID=1168545 RepID=A0A6G1J244_9PLEO|nr:hypothetical protein K458DRAFT_451500 [Lentithecium fluviatile CBS 122367]
MQPVVQREAIDRHRTSITLIPSPSSLILKIAAVNLRACSSRLLCFCAAPPHSLVKRAQRETPMCMQGGRDVRNSTNEAGRAGNPIKRYAANAMQIAQTDAKTYDRWPREYSLAPKERHTRSQSRCGHMSVAYALPLKVVQMRTKLSTTLRPKKAPHKRAHIRRVRSKKREGGLTIFTGTRENEGGKRSAKRRCLTTELNRPFARTSTRPPGLRDIRIRTF